MSLAAWYLHKVDQCARLAEDARPRERSEFESERKAWLEILVEEIGAEAATIALAEGGRRSVA